MITFIIGIAILFLGYIFYSKYVEGVFAPNNEETPAIRINDGIDFVPMKKWQNSLIQLLNIAGIGPLMGAVQGILFGPIAFLLIPIGCIFMGGVHDYFSGMISLRNDGAQITGLVKKFLGKKLYIFFVLTISIMLLLLSVVFVYTSGDLIGEKFFGINDFSLSNPILVTIYIAIGLYFILATLFPIDKIIGKLYPIFGALLLFGTTLVMIGFFTHGLTLQELNIKHINLHPKHFAIIPIFFATVSCGMLSGFHSTQSTIISRTLTSEYEGREVFYGMMCIESVIAMIWAAGANYVYTQGLVPTDLIGKANVLNIIANTFVPHILTYLVTFAIVILPITSGDTALRSLRLLIAESLGWKKASNKKCLIIITPIAILMILILIYAKLNNDSFFLIWRYFTCLNQIIALVIFMLATIYLRKHGKNFLITFIPMIFYLFVTSVFILNSNICFNLTLTNSRIIGIFITIIGTLLFIKKFLTNNIDDIVRIENLPKR